MLFLYQESVPVNDLALIHRYRPHSPDIGKAPEYGDVQNYNCHVGAALHTKQYVDFYLREGRYNVLVFNLYSIGSTT